MKVFFEHDRLELVPEDNFEERFAKRLVRLVDAVSNDLTAWYGDIENEEYRGGGYIIGDKVPGVLQVPESED